jgi:hypothetical protein
VNVDRLVALYPRLYHMAHAGSWPAIRDHGLMTTAQLVDAYMPPPDVRTAILGSRRTRRVSLEHPDLGRVVIRDQSPLREHILATALTGMTVTEWLDVLNDRVFFWLHPDRLEQLLRARRYRDEAHDVLTVDTARLVSAYAERVRLSAINSGSTLYPNAPKRGSSTFLPIEAYPYEEIRRRRPVRDAIAEFAVVGGVPDIARYVVRVERRRQSEVLS